jgi:RNA polymerase sigma-70 factor (sigma-E family)
MGRRGRDVVNFPGRVRGNLVGGWAVLRGVMELMDGLDEAGDGGAAGAAIGAGEDAAARAVATEFTRFVSESSPRLLRTAWLLTSHREHAQDLTQLAYAKTFAAWRRVRSDDAEAYARRVMVNSYIDWWRRAPWRERPTAQLPEQDVVPDHAGAIDERRALTAALAQLTRRERTIVVLRYYIDLSESDVAAYVGVSVGTVKSTASKALAKLRRSPALQDIDVPDFVPALEEIP